MFARTSTFIVIGSIVAQSVYAQNFLLSEVSKKLGLEYLSCVNDQALRLSPAGESVTDTVEFAKTACERFKLNIALSIMDDVNTEMPKTAPEARLNVTQKLRESFYDQITQAARLKLARVRSESPKASN